MLKQRVLASSPAMQAATTPATMAHRNVARRVAPATAAPKRAGPFMRSVAPTGTRAPVQQQIKSAATTFGVQRAQRADCGLTSLREEAVRMSTEQVSALNKIDTLTQQCKDAQAECKHQEELLKAAEQRNVKLEGDLKQQAKAFVDIKGDIEGASFKIADMGAALGEADKNIKEADDRAKWFDARLNAAAGAHAGIVDKCKNLEAAHANVQGAMKRLELTHASMTKENETLKARSDSLQTAADTAKADAADQRERVAALEAKIIELEQHAHERLSSAAEHARGLSNELAETKAAGDAAAARAEEATKASNVLKNELDEIDAEVSRLKAELNGAENTLVSWQTKHEEVVKNFDALKIEADERGMLLEASEGREKELKDALAKSEQSKADDAARVDASLNAARKEVSDKYTAMIDELNAEHAAELKRVKDECTQAQKDALDQADGARDAAAAVAQTTREREDAVARVAGLEEELQRAREDLDAKAAAAIARNELLESTAAELNASKQTAAEAAETIKKRDDEISQLRGAIDQNAADYEELKKSSRTELAEMTAAYEELKASAQKRATAVPKKMPSLLVPRNAKISSARFTRASARHPRLLCAAGIGDLADVVAADGADGILTSANDTRGPPPGVRFDANCPQPPDRGDAAAGAAAAGEADFTALDGALDADDMGGEDDGADDAIDPDSSCGVEPTAAETEDAMAILLGGYTPVEEGKRDRRATRKGEKRPAPAARGYGVTTKPSRTGKAAGNQRHPTDAYVSTGDTDDARLPGNHKVLRRREGIEGAEVENLMERFEQAEGSSGESPNVIASADKGDKSTARGGAKKAVAVAAPKPRGARRGQQPPQKKRQVAQKKKPAAAADSEHRAQPTAADAQRPSKRPRVTIATAKRGVRKKMSQDPYDLDTLSMCDAFGF